MDPEFFERLMGGPPPARSPMSLLLRRAAVELQKLNRLVPAVEASSPEIAKVILAEAERVCTAAAALYAEGRHQLDVDPVAVLTPVVPKVEGPPK
jgi:hypothetical protein